jgi:hypothetical protein
MEFRLTYAGPLLAHRNDKRLAERSRHVHAIRKEFHKQLDALWKNHPTLQQIIKDGASVSMYVGGNGPEMQKIFQHDGFNWVPIVTEHSGLICKLGVLMLRGSPPGKALFDIDNCLKTLFDALRKAKSSFELGAGTTAGQARPDPNEDPFYVLRGPRMWPAMACIPAIPPSPMGM